MPALNRTPSIVVVADPLTLRGQGAPKRFRLRSLQRSLATALVVAGLLLTWAAAAAQASGIFWVNNASNTIGRANLDGTGVNQSFITGLDDPRGLAVDGSYIYWVNAGTNTIDRANLDGTGVTGLIFIPSSLQTIDAPYSVAVDGSHIYWTNTESGVETIGRANLDGTGVNESFITGVSFPFGIAISLVPEPATGLLVMVGVLGLAVSRRRAGASA